jgi:hypothetical protein
MRTPLGGVEISEERHRNYRVHMHSKPSPAWTYYEGHVDVLARDDEHARAAAIDKLKRTAFLDRPRDSWVIDKVEIR